jgi:hypothetical protein
VTTLAPARRTPARAAARRARRRTGTVPLTPYVGVDNEIGTLTWPDALGPRQLPGPAIFTPAQPQLYDASVSQVAVPASSYAPAASNRAAIFWGVVVGAMQAATPLLIWWLDSATVYAVGLAVIAAIYVGFAVADGRTRVIAVETSVAFAFVVLACAAISGTPWLLVIGYVGHGLKDLWQHRTQFVSGTRWWPPFCMFVDWVLAAIIVVEIAAGLDFS